MNLADAVLAESWNVFSNSAKIASVRSIFRKKDGTKFENYRKLVRTMRKNKKLKHCWDMNKKVSIK